MLVYEYDPPFFFLNFPILFEQIIAAVLEYWRDYFIWGGVVYFKVESFVEVKVIVL